MSLVVIKAEMRSLVRAKITKLIESKHFCV
nr:MAG TPA: hypothetical protein [Caudoviricetes sp.]